MESVGQKLREARLRRRLTLDDVSAATKINVKNLEAIESDDLGRMSSPFLYRSFARQFASFVEVEAAEFERGLAEASDRIPKPLVPGEAGAPLPASTKGPKTGKMRWGLSFGSLGLMLALCSMFYATWQNSRTVVKAQRVETKPEPQKAQPAPPAAVEQSSNPRDFRLELVGVEQSWLSVVTGGKEVYTGVLQPAETKVVDGVDEAKIRTGNAGGVSVSFNGRSLGTLGRRGEVRTVVFTRNGYEALEPTAAVTVPKQIGE